MLQNRSQKGSRKKTNKPARESAQIGATPAQIGQRRTQKLMYLKRVSMMLH